MNCIAAGFMLAAILFHEPARRSLAAWLILALNAGWAAAWFIVPALTSK